VIWPSQAYETKQGKRSREQRGLSIPATMSPTLDSSSVSCVVVSVWLLSGLQTCGPVHAGVVRRVNGSAKVNRVAMERGWRASALRLLDVVEPSVEVR
jgi:hypothetical protein